MTRPATDKQLNYLKDLGYRGIAPATLSDASELIDAMKEGFKSAEAERAVLVERNLPVARARRVVAEVEDCKRHGNQIAGWRLKIDRGAETAQNSLYKGAFLPFEVGKRHPELLAISGLDAERIQRRPAKGPVVDGPGRISEITPGPSRAAPAQQVAAQAVPQPKRAGCLGVVLLMALLFAGAASLVWSAEPQELTATVASIVDGDTIVLADGDKVRLLGVDTPETVHPAKPVEAFGREASEFTKKQLAGEEVRLVLDPVNTVIKHRDKYGRLLAYVHRSRDAYDFKAQAVREGYAHAYVRFPFSRMDEFVQLQKEAREAGRGLWAPKPAALVAAAASTTFYVTKSGTKYH